MVGICKSISYYSQSSDALGITAIAYESERCISHSADGGSVNPLEIIGADIVAEAEIIAPPRPAISFPSSCKAGRHHIVSFCILSNLFPHGHLTES